MWEGTLGDGSIPPYEGENGISWATTGLGWFGAGIMSIQPVNLYNFGDGFLKFRIKIPSNIAFQIGIIDAWGNQSYVEFPSGQTKYGLVRNGEWGQASIPIEDIRGPYIDLRMLSYEFVILEVNGAACEFALDDIYWDGGGSVHIVDEQKNMISNHYLLGDNYPNPFNPSTKFSYIVPEDGFISLNIYDLKGNRINELISGYKPRDNYSISWNGTDDGGRFVPAGIYFYTMKTEKQMITKKMVLLK